MTNLKKIMLLLMVAITGTVALSSCSDDDEGGKLTPPVTLSITAADITDVSASVTVTPSDTGRYYVTIYPTTYVEGKTDAQLVNSVAAIAGFDAKLVKGEKKFDYTNLDPSTSYTMVAFGWNGQEAGTVAKQQFTTEKKRIPQVASSYFDVDYWADVYHNGFHNYIVYMGDASHESINLTSAGTIYTFSLYTKNAPGSDLMPEEGHYSMIPAESTEPVDHCIEFNESCKFTTTRFVSKDDYTLSTESLNDAQLDIKKNADGTVTVSAVIVEADGTQKELTYTGAVVLKDRSFKGYTGPTISEDLEFTADYTAGYNYTGTQFEIMTGGDPNADDAEWNNRHRLTIYLAGEQTEDGKYVPPVGTFQVSRDDMAGFVWQGEYVDLGSGVEGPQGSYYYFLDSKWKSYYAFVVGGSVTIAKGDSEGEYVVDANFKDSNNHSIKAHYKGTFPTTFASSAKAHRASAKYTAKTANATAKAAKKNALLKAALTRLPK